MVCQARICHGVEGIETEHQENGGDHKNCRQGNGLLLFLGGRRFGFFIIRKSVDIQKQYQRRNEPEYSENKRCGLPTPVQADGNNDQRSDRKSGKTPEGMDGKGPAQPMFINGFAENGIITGMKYAVGSAGQTRQYVDPENGRGKSHETKTEGHNREPRNQDILCAKSVNDYAQRVLRERRNNAEYCRDAAKSGIAHLEVLAHQGKERWQGQNKEVAAKMRKGNERNNSAFAGI